MRKRKTDVSALPAVDADENGCEKDTARWRKGK